MNMDFLDLKTVYLIAHVFGAILGAGGAFASDAMFFSTVRDGRIDREELRFMKLGSKLVWSGLILLVISGALLVSTDPERYLSSGKFLAKMSIVGIIILNGAVFHLIHIPHIRNHLGLKFAESATFIKRAPFLLASGAISGVSWVSTVILGMLKQVPYDYYQIMGAYLLILVLAMATAVAGRKIILRLP
jgi:hypothetical protein